MDKAAILAEIAELTAVPEIREGDITIRDVMELLGLGRSGAVGRMAPLVESGAYETLMVYDPASRTQRRVWRKVE